MDEKTSAKERAFLEWDINGLQRLRDQVHVVDVCSDPNNAMRLLAYPRNELDDRVGPIKMAIDGVAAGEHAAGQGFTDDNYRVVRLAVKIVEITARDDGSPNGRKKARRDDAHLRARIFARMRNVAIAGKFEAYGPIVVAPGCQHTEGGAIDAG